MVLRCPYILRRAKKLPNGPGVYVFLDKKNKPLYVGRATSLRRRVISYFHLSVGPGLNLRIEEMLNTSRSIKHYKTDSVLEAIILESNLIKKYWPKYNVREKDSRSFVYVLISKKDDFPRPVIFRGQEIRNRKLEIRNFYIFGPYQSLSLIKTGLRIIRKIFPYSVCKIGSGKPCFDYQIGLCPGACVGHISKEDYRENIDNLILFLRGDKKRLLKKLQKENPEKINALKHIQDVALISRDEFTPTLAKMNKIEGYDISHLTGKETYGSMVVFTDGKPDKTQYRLFKIMSAPANDDLRALEEVITRRFRHREWPYPDLVLIDGGKPQIDYLSKSFKKINITVPFVGISKFAGDKLVFPPKFKKPLKELIETMENTLLRVREEAHRFALKASRRSRRKMIK